MAFLFIILIGLFLRVFTPLFKGCLTIVVALAIIGWSIRHHPEIIQDFWDLVDNAIHTIHE